MFINYEEKELTDLFQTAPIDFFEKEAGMFMYRFTDTYGNKIIIDVSIYENEVTLSQINQKEEVIQEQKLKNVEKLKEENGCLHIYQWDKKRNIIVQLRPNISVNCMDD